MYSFAHTKRNKEDVKQVPIPIEFIPIMQEIRYNYFINEKRDKIISNTDNGLLLNSNEEKKLSSSIYERLCKNDISKAMLFGTGADNFAHAINEILSEKSIRELCIKDNNFALQITQYILGFITKTQQHILEINNHFENEKQLLLKSVLSTPKNFEESWKIAAPFIQLTMISLILIQHIFIRNFKEVYLLKKKQIIILSLKM
jgi:hypothetical protein